MRTRRLTLTPVVLPLVSGILGGLFWGGTPALAAAPVANLIVPIAGTVDGGPEGVALSGRVQVMSTLALDPDFGTPPSVVLVIRLIGVSGVGLSTGKSYIASGEENVIRRLAPSDLVEVTFPFFPIGAGGSNSARPAVATFSLSFDIDIGQLKAATASFTTPAFPG